MKVEIKDIGIFEIKHNYLHRGLNPRIVTFEKGKYKCLQFNGYREDILAKYFQDGFDFELNKIQIRLID